VKLFEILVIPTGVEDRFLSGALGANARAE